MELPPFGNVTKSRAETIDIDSSHAYMYSRISRSISDILHTQFVSVCGLCACVLSIEKCIRYVLVSHMLRKHTRIILVCMCDVCVIMCVGNIEDDVPSVKAFVAVPKPFSV